MDLVSKILVFSVVFCSVASLNVPPQIVSVPDAESRGPIDDSLYDLVDSLRYSLRCGFPELGVPSLAPFIIQTAEVDERGLLYALRGNLRDLKVAGLDGYKIDQSTFNILTLRISLGLTFPKISLTGLYELDALLLRFLPIFGHGRLADDVNDLKIQANGRLSILSGRLNMTSLAITVDLGSFYSDNTGIYDSRIVSTLFNVAFERMVEDVFRNNKANIETTLQDLLLPIANDYLNNLSLQDFINLITGGLGSDGPYVDEETGEIVCDRAVDTTTTELTDESGDDLEDDGTTLPVETSDEPGNDETLPSDSTSDEGEIESTTNRIDPGVDNSSNFLFDKFQVMILTVVSIVSLRTL